jgi:hypothetical protein
LPPRERDSAALAGLARAARLGSTLARCHPGLL